VGHLEESDQAMKRILFLIMVSSIATGAQGLPKNPHSRTVDKAFVLATIALGASYAADEASTAAWIHRCSSCVEVGWFDHGGRSLPRIAAGDAAFDVGLMFAAYEWKKHVHNRVVNKLWILAPAWGTEGHVYAAIRNSQLR
jgi:hypothetical protein